MLTRQFLFHVPREQFQYLRSCRHFEGEVGEFCPLWSLRLCATKSGSKNGEDVLEAPDQGVQTRVQFGNGGKRDGVVQEAVVQKGRRQKS